MKKIFDRKITIAFRFVALTAYVILVVPILLFFFGWLKWYLAIFFSSILLAGMYLAIKRDYWNNMDDIEIPVRNLFIVIAAFAFWLFISGSCYTSVAKCDIIWRNSTLRDLVNYDWPVYYPDRDGYLCYYFVFWMVPALAGKIFGGMWAAYIALACWFILILLTSFLLITYYFKDYSDSVLKIILLFMIMWSGINILGDSMMYSVGQYPTAAGIGNNEGYCDALCNNGKPFHFLYRSNDDFLSQCYNQLPIWIVVPLMLQNRRIHNYAFLGLLLYPFSPWGTVGIALMMLVDAVAFLVKRKSISKLIREALSVPNLCAIFSVFVVFFMFFGCANFFEDSQKFGIIGLKDINLQILIGIIIFWLSEFGIFYYLTWWKYKKDYLYVSVLIMLLTMPFIWVSSRYSRDFCMDATLPQLYMLMIYMIGYIKEEFLRKDGNRIRKFELKNCLLVVFLGLAFTTPVFDWIGDIKKMYDDNKISIQDESVMSFSDILGYEGEFSLPMAINVDESVFFKYFARTLDMDQWKWLPISDDFSNIRNIDDIDEYFDYLQGKDCMIFIAVQEIQGYCFTQETADKMKQIGFDDNINKLLEKECHSFLGIVDNGQIVTENIGGDEYITYLGEGLVDGDNVWMESGTLNHENCSVIDIGNGHYSAHGRGLNIAVWDNVSKRVIDAVAFDTHAEDMACTRKVQ